MNNSAHPAPGPSPTPPRGARAVRLVFGPDLRLLLVALPGAALAGLIALLATDPVQRFFSAVVVLVLLAVAGSDLLFRPRLVVDADGLRVNAPFDRVRLPWGAVESVRATTSQRYGLRTVVLEIDAGERLIVLDRRDLAADPWAVAQTITDFRPPRLTR